MRHIWIWVVACVLLLHTIHVVQTHSQIHNFYEWTYEPNVNGTLHVKLKVTLSATSGSFGFSASESSPIENMKAWEADTQNPINISVEKKGDRIHYTVELPGMKGKGFQFYVEYDRLNAVTEQLDDVFYFYYGWGSPYLTTHTATAILPKKHELLYTNYNQPVNVTSQMDRLYVEFEEEVPEDGSFRVGVMFSQKGVQLLKKAESNFRLGQYNDAKSAYEDSIEFYSQFEELYGKDINSFLADLRDKVRDCEVKREEERVESSEQLGDEKYEEAVAAYNSGDYAGARQLFQQAQNAYLSAGNSEKADECQTYIETCDQSLEQGQQKTDADALFDEGIDLFDQQQYEDAKAKFEEALAAYTDLGDEEKVQECKDWISSCEEQMGGEEDGGGTCMGSGLIVLAFLGAALTKELRSMQK